MNGETPERHIGESLIVQSYTKPLVTHYWRNQGLKSLIERYETITLDLMNRRIPNGTYGGVRGRGLVTPSYSISQTRSKQRALRFCASLEDLSCKMDLDKQVLIAVDTNIRENGMTEVKKR